MKEVQYHLYHGHLRTDVGETCQARRICAGRAGITGIIRSAAVSPRSASDTAQT